MEQGQSRPAVDTHLYKQLTTRAKSLTNASRGRTRSLAWQAMSQRREGVCAMPAQPYGMR